MAIVENTNGNNNGHAGNDNGHYGNNKGIIMAINGNANGHKWQ